MKVAVIRPMSHPPQSARIRLVFAIGARVVALPDGLSELALEDRIGPVLADIVTGCVPGKGGEDIHIIALPEIPSAALGEPLEHFMLTGKIPFASNTPTLRLVPAYKAADRLNMKHFVLEVERVAMSMVGYGALRLADVAKAFAGCVRIEALCENYLKLPGMSVPPPYDISLMAAQHGAIFVVFRNTDCTDSDSDSDTDTYAPSGTSLTDPTFSYAVFVYLESARSRRRESRLCDAVMRIAEKTKHEVSSPWTMMIDQASASEPYLPCIEHDATLACKCVSCASSDRTIDPCWWDVDTWLERPWKCVFRLVLLSELRHKEVLLVASLSGEKLYSKGN